MPCVRNTYFTLLSPRFRINSASFSIPSNRKTSTNRSASSSRSFNFLSLTIIFSLNNLNRSPFLNIRFSFSRFRTAQGDANPAPPPSPSLSSSTSPRSHTPASRIPRSVPFCSIYLSSRVRFLSSLSSKFHFRNVCESLRSWTTLVLISQRKRSLANRTRLARRYSSKSSPLLPPSSGKEIAH